MAKLKRLGICVGIALGIWMMLHLLRTTRQSPYAYRDRFVTVLHGGAPEEADDSAVAGGSRSGSVELSSLVDLTDFEYTLQPARCEDEELLGLLIITSYAGHDELRSAHRRAMPATQLAALQLRRVFLLATIPPAELYIAQPALEAEHTRFGDLLQGNFQEAYRNLTYKHVMGLRWASGGGGCPAKFIVKADDDTVFDLYHLHGHLLELLDTDALRSPEFLAGFVLAAQKPIRNVANKWYVSREEFAGSVYPDYLSGWLYLTNPETAARLVDRAQRERFMWIDDTWVTGVLREPLQIPLIGLNRWFSANAEFLDCCVADLKRYGVRCDYSVGPNGGDGRLLGEFVRAVERCYVFGGGEEDGSSSGSGGCAERRPEQSLARTCVARSKHLVEEHGRAVVAAVRL